MLSNGLVTGYVSALELAAAEAISGEDEGGIEA